MKTPTPGQCAARVYRPGGTFKGSPCAVRAQYTVDGQRWCHIHNPARRRKAEVVRWGAIASAFDRAEAAREALRHRAMLVNEVVRTARLWRQDGYEEGLSRAVARLDAHDGYDTPRKEVTSE